MTGTLAAGELTAPYSSGFAVHDGTGPFLWSLSSGPLPTGLTLDTSTGLITGTPTTAGSYPVTIRATDANNGTTTRSGMIRSTRSPT